MIVEMDAAKWNCPPPTRALKVRCTVSRAITSRFPDRLKQFHIQFYALNKDGEYGAGSLWGMHPDGRHVEFAVHDGTKARLVPCTPLFDKAGGDS